MSEKPNSWLKFHQFVGCGGNRRVEGSFNMFHYLYIKGNKNARANIQTCKKPQPHDHCYCKKYQAEMLLNLWEV